MNIHCQRKGDITVTNRDRNNIMQKSGMDTVFDYLMQPDTERR